MVRVLRAKSAAITKNRRRCNIMSENLLLVETKAVSFLVLVEFVSEAQLVTSWQIPMTGNEAKPVRGLS